MLQCTCRISNHDTVLPMGFRCLLIWEGNGFRSVPVRYGSSNNDSVIIRVCPTGLRPQHCFPFHEHTEHTCRVIAKGIPSVRIKGRGVKHCRLKRTGHSFQMHWKSSTCHQSGLMQKLTTRESCGQLRGVQYCPCSADGWPKASRVRGLCYLTHSEGEGGKERQSWRAVVVVEVFVSSSF